MHCIFTLVALVFGTALIPHALADTRFDKEKFCSDRPVGLYCSPDSIYQKVECPSGNITTCQKSPNEFCQERGILKQYGFKGGIARCVPHLNNDTVTAFCDSRSEPGSYCFGDKENNVRIVCPSGLIYKCADDPNPDTRKCFQKSANVAICRKKTDGGGEISNGTCIDQLITLTITETETKTTTITKRLKKKTKTVTVTETQSCPFIESVETPTPLPKTETLSSLDTTSTVYTTTEVYKTTESDQWSTGTVIVETTTPPVVFKTKTSYWIVTPTPSRD